MSATSQLTTFSDLYTDLMNRVRVNTSETATVTQAKRYINIALQDMHIGFGEKFPWAERRAVLRTHPEYTTGTVTATKGSNSLTGSGTAWNTANDFGENNARVGGKMIIDSSPEVYEVTAVGSDVTATLNVPWIDTTASSLSYKYFEDEYSLASDFLRPFDLQSFDVNSEIRLIGRREFRFMFPRNKITGRPRIATLVDRAFSGNTTPVRKIRFHKPPNDTYLFEYAYITSNLAVSSSGTTASNLVNDNDEPIVPLQYRHAIVFHSLYHWYRDKKNDTRSVEAKAEYVDVVTRIVNNHEIGRSRPQIRPELSTYTRASKQPYRRRARSYGRFVTGTAFDEIR